MSFQRTSKKFFIDKEKNMSALFVLTSKKHNLYDFTFNGIEDRGYLKDVKKRYQDIVEFLENIEKTEENGE